MFLRDWLHSFRTPTVRRCPKVQRRPTRLQLERLEDRITPATTINVANAIDLQNAINNQVNSNPTQQFLVNFTGSSYDLEDIGDQLTIDNSAGVTLQGNGAVIDAASSYRLFQIQSGSNVTFENLTLEGGFVIAQGGAEAQGGGILALGGNLTLSHVVLQNNSAVGSASTSSGGTSGGAAAGGGIYISGGTLTIGDSVIRNNKAIAGTSAAFAEIGQGGGIYSTNCTVNIVNSSITENSAVGGQGGISSTTGGSGLGGGVMADGIILTILNSSITKNIAEGGGGSPGVPAGTGGGGAGGGLYNSSATIGPSGTTVTMINTTVAENQALGGRGGDATQGNGGAGGNGNGAGVYEASFHANNYLNDTIAFNSASGGLGGSAGAGGGPGTPGSSFGGGFERARLSFDLPILTNTVLEKNGASSGPDFDGNVDSDSNNNFVSNDSGASGFNSTNILNNPTLQLGTAAVAPNGTTYYPLLASSVAVNQGNNSALTTIAATEGVPENEATDQIGTPRVLGPTIDIGAAEAKNQPTITSVTNATAPYSPTSQIVPMSASVVFGNLFSPSPLSVNGGTVTFTVYNVSTPIGSVTGNVSNGTASANFTVPAGLSAGNYTLVATYHDSSGNYQDSSSFGTLAITSTSAPTSTTATNAAAPFTNEDPEVALTARVTSYYGVPVNAGQVQFTVAGLTTQPIVAPVVNGVARATFGVPPNTPLGNYNILATFVDALNNYLSSVATSVLTIFASPTTVAMNNVSIVYGFTGVQETLTAVARNALGVVVNSGFVTFTDGQQTMTAPIVNGLATVTLNIPLAQENPFAHTIFLAFGDSAGNFLPSSGSYLVPDTLMEFLIQMFVVQAMMQASGG